jgi:hypothetical protein
VNSLMAVDARPIEVDNVLHEERFFGGDIVWWVLIVSIPALLFGLSLWPAMGGYLLVTIAGIAAGIGFAQIILRLPYLTKRFALSVLIVLVLSAVIGLIGQVYSTSLPVTSPRADVMYKPPISGG